VNVPIDVTYTTGSGATTSTSTQHKQLRVVQENGVLLIDALAKLADLVPALPVGHRGAGRSDDQFARSRLWSGRIP